MNKNKTILFGLFILLITGCSYENAIDLYYKGEEIKPVSTNGLLANITFDKGIKDVSENKTSVAINGDVVFVKGVDGKDSSAIQLQGFPQSIAIGNIGLNDTLSIFMWFKTGALLSKTDSLTLFDYGVKSFALQIDGSTGSTLINTTHNNQQATIPDYINSYTAWNYLYAEAGGGKIKVMYEGQNKSKELITLDIETESPGILEPVADILYIGRSTASQKVSNSYFKGSIDNVRIYNRPLSKSEVLSLISEDKAK